MSFVIYDNYGREVGTEDFPEPPRAKVLTAEKFSYIDFVTPLARYNYIPNLFLPGAVHGAGFLEVEHQNRLIRVYGINEEQQRDEFESALGGIIESVVSIDELRSVIDARLEGELSATERAQITDPFFEPFTPLETVQKVLGERFFKMLQADIPVKWKLSKENVPRLRRMIESHHFDFEVGADFSKYKEEKDHILNREELYFLFPITKMIQDPAPRVESLQLALRAYFEIAHLVEQATEEMRAQIRCLKKGIPKEQWPMVEIDLERAVTQEDKFKICESLLLPIALTEQQKIVFIDLLKMVWDEEILAPVLEPFPPLEPEELADFEPEKYELDLDELEENALNSLNLTCHSLQLAIMFRRKGREVWLGATNNPRAAARTFQEIGKELADGPDLEIVEHFET